jgi:hypothetical protein
MGETSRRVSSTALMPRQAVVALLVHDGRENPQGRTLDHSLMNRQPPTSIAAS